MHTISRGDGEAANSIRTDGRRSFPANAALERILRQKLKKTYATGAVPGCLLLFYDRQAPLGPFDYLLQLQQEIAGLTASSVFPAHQSTPQRSVPRAVTAWHTLRSTSGTGLSGKSA